MLHWRPRRVGPITIDSHLAQEHRAHHADPRDLPLVFIPWRALLWLLPASNNHIVIYYCHTTSITSLGHGF